MAETQTKTESARAEKAQETKRHPEPAVQDLGALGGELASFNHLLGTALTGLPVERHASILGDTRLSHPANAPQKARLVSELQLSYGNAHMQRVVEQVGRSQGAQPFSQNDESSGKSAHAVQAKLEPSPLDDTNRVQLVPSRRRRRVTDVIRVAWHEDVEVFSRRVAVQARDGRLGVPDEWYPIVEQAVRPVHEALDQAADYRRPAGQMVSLRAVFNCTGDMSSTLRLAPEEIAAREERRRRRIAEAAAPAPPERRRPREREEEPPPETPVGEPPFSIDPTPFDDIAFEPAARPLLATDTFAPLRGHIITRLYRIVPQLRNRTNNVVYYLAYNPRGGRTEWAVGPRRLDSFRANETRYLIAAGNAFGFGELRPQQVSSHQVGYLWMRGEYGAAIEALGDAWLEALQDPMWWMEAIPATAGAVGGPARAGARATAAAEARAGAGAVEAEAGVAEAARARPPARGRAPSAPRRGGRAPEEPAGPRRPVAEEEPARAGMPAEGVSEWPEGLVHEGLNRYSVRESYQASIREVPGREAGIWRNPATGEYVCVQGEHEFVTTDWMTLPENFRGGRMPRWELVDHYHPIDHPVHCVPSAGDFQSRLHWQLEGAEPAARVRSTVTYTDPQSHVQFTSEFGYDPGAIEPYWVRYRRNNGLWRVERFRDPPWEPGSSYSQWLSRFTGD